MLNHFNDEMLRQHRQPSTRVISSDILPASPVVARRLELELDEPVIKIIRLRLANGRPLIHESRFMAQRLCPDLLNEDLETQSIHSLLISKFQIPLTKITHTIEACSLPAQEAQLLGVEAGTEAFFIDRLTYTNSPAGQEQPAVSYRAYYREHVYHFQAEFEGDV